MIYDLNVKYDKIDGHILLLLLLQFQLLQYELFAFVLPR